MCNEGYSTWSVHTCVCVYVCVCFLPSYGNLNAKRARYAMNGVLLCLEVATLFAYATKLATCDHAYGIGLMSKS